jgi:hypothetical protein
MNDASDPAARCEWLHRHIERLPAIRWPFALADLPSDGIYFFYEAGELWGHGGDHPRIVRIGTHKDGNFRSRLAEHYGFKPWLVSLDRPSRKDRSIFRKNVGRALLYMRSDPYLPLWDVDLISRAKREQYRSHRDLEKEQALESEITNLLRARFQFRFLVLADSVKRMGSEGMESRLIGTVSRCSKCAPSPAWLGLNSPRKPVRQPQSAQTCTPAGRQA